MNKPEQKFWTLLRPQMPGDVSRIENMVDSGTPDVSGAWFKDYWVELKVSENKVKEQDLYKLLRPSQKVWHFRRGKSGSLIFVFVKYPKFFLMYKYMPKLRFDETHLGMYILRTAIRKVKGKWEWAKFQSKIEELINEG